MAVLEDIAPALLAQLQEDFHARIKKNRRLQDLLKLVTDGKATYIEAEEIAYEMGTALSQAFGNCLSSAVLPDGKMYYNIAQRVIGPLLEEDHQLLSQITEQVQASLNKKASIGLKAQTVAVDEDRIYGIVNKISEAETFDDMAWMLGDPVVNFSQNVVDSTMKANVNFQGKAGLRPKIIRKAESRCCKWCRNLAGVYEYPMVPDDVYRRHERCRCQVDYDPGDGRRQNVHTKKWTGVQAGGKISKGEENGAVTGAKKNPGWKNRHAERYYEEIRNRSANADAKRIAEHVSELSADQIEDIRQHIFIREQPRAGGLARFDADYDMAQAWQRLVSGKDIRPSDKILLMHEYEELTIMRATGCAYEEAHEKANLKYDWWKAFMEEE